MTDPSTHAATVREALEAQVFGSAYRKDVLAALEALQAQAEQADGLRVDFDIAHQEYGEEATAHGATRERAETAEADNDRLAARVEELEAVLRRVRTNARSWHGPELDNGHARALAVIAEWCDAALDKDTA